MIITIEGCDGSGKSTIADWLARRLSAQLIAFPDDDAPLTGAAIRQYLRREWEVAGNIPGIQEEREAQLSALCHQALNVMNRAQRLDTIRQAPIVVLARGWESGFVYGKLDGLPPEVAEVSRKLFELGRPQLHLLLDVSPQIAMGRREVRDGKLPPERYEGKLDRLAEVRSLYTDLWTSERQKAVAPITMTLALIVPEPKKPDPPGRWVVVDADENLETVKSLVDQTVTKFLRDVAVGVLR